MYLSSGQKRRSENLFNHLKNRPIKFLKEYGIEKCEICKGTGLIVSNILTWDGNSYCAECHGVGYQGLKNLPQIDEITFICGNCNGIGCDNCTNGITDWISHIMGR